MANADQSGEQPLSPIQRLIVDFYGTDGSGGMKAEFKEWKEKVKRHDDAYTVFKWIGWILGPTGILYFLSQFLPGFINGG